MEDTRMWLARERMTDLQRQADADRLVRSVRRTRDHRSVLGRLRGGIG